MFNHCFLRRNIIALLTLLLAFTGIQTALAANEKSKATINPGFDVTCEGATVTSTKDISNIVIVFVGGEFEKFEDFPEGTTMLTLDVVDDMIIETVYVKSGSEKFGKMLGLPGMLGEKHDCTPASA